MEDYTQAALAVGDVIVSGESYPAVLRVPTFANGKPRHSVIIEEDY